MMSASHKSAAAIEDTRSFQRVKLFGIEWPFPRWALGPGAVLLLIAAAAFLAKTVVLPAVADWQENRDEQRAKSYELRVVEEKAKHFDMHETPEVVKSLEGLLTISYYKSDGCIQVSRNTGTPGDQKWLFDLSRVQRDPAPGRIAAAEPAALGALPWEGTAWAQGTKQKCLAHHPGKFKQWEGERRKCWVQIFRQWDDGCRQYQWYDSCYAVWDTNKDGSLKVYWQACRH